LNEYVRLVNEQVGKKRQVTPEEFLAGKKVAMG
jgi:hypothetical protein